MTSPGPMAAPTSGPIVGVSRSTDLQPVGFVRPGVGTASSSPPGRLIRYQGESHLMTFGSTGSGKTSGPVISNARDHPGSLVSIECKGDVYEATHQDRRRKGQEVAVIDLRGDRATDGLNPIDLFQKAGGGPDVIARTMAATMVPRSPYDEIFWRNWGETMLTSGIGRTLQRLPLEEQNLGAVYDLFNNDDVAYRLAVLLDTEGGALHRAFYSGFASFLQLPERETRPSVLASTQQHLMLWESDMVRRLTDRTTFDLDGLIEGRPMSLYIIVPPMRLEAYAPLLRLMLAGLIAAFLTRTHQPEHRTLMLCDELAALGRLDAFVTASVLLRSAGLQLWSFWQNPAQLEAYGHDARTLVDNAGVLQLLGARNHRMAGEFAALVGGVTAEDIMAMSLDDQLIMIDGGRPQTLRRLRWFEHPELHSKADASGPARS